MASNPGVATGSRSVPAAEHVRIAANENINNKISKKYTVAVMQFLLFQLGRDMSVTASKRQTQPAKNAAALLKRIRFVASNPAAFHRSPE